MSKQASERMNELTYLLTILYVLPVHMSVCVSVLDLRVTDQSESSGRAVSALKLQASSLQPPGRTS